MTGKQISRPVLNEAENDEFSWTDEQLVVLRAIERGENVFLFGEAGTGKSTIIKNITKKLQG
jgi:MoxR-like ATPase